MSELTIKDAQEKMDKTVTAFQDELGQLRTARATTGMLDIVEVEVYGSKMKLNQLGTISVPDAHLIVIDLWDKSQLAAVEKAIFHSPLDLTPSNDGSVIRIPVPQMTEERRKDLVKVAGNFMEEAKVSIRNIRRQALETIKKNQKDGDIPEDDAHKMSDRIQKMTDDHTNKIEDVFKAKEQDIMSV